MSYISTDNLNSIHIELSNYCNAACPMCARFDWDGQLQTNYVNSHHIPLDLIKTRLGPETLGKLKKFWSNGTFGDGIINPECLEIFQYVREINSTCQLTIQTNGGARNRDFWHNLGSIPGMTVIFSIDGLEDTNHLYRRNVDWNRLMANVKSFISAGGDAGWNMLVFRHNEHQIEQAEKIAKNLGFRFFHARYSERWTQRNWVHFDQYRKLPKLKVDDYFLEPPTTQPESKVSEKSKSFNFDDAVDCQVCTANLKEIYVRSTGQVQPCCMIGEIDRHEVGKLVDDSDSINLHHTTLKNILEGAFFQKMAHGIAGGSTRLQNCFYTCGNKEPVNDSPMKHIPKNR